MKRHHHISRGGFTLVELLVVMALIVLLAALMIGFFPSVTTSAREARGATLLQTWLNIAKQRALRDQTPTGIRLMITPGSMQVVQCQYISQPEDFCSGKITTSPSSLNKVLFDFSSVPFINLTNGYAMTDVPFFAVQPNDSLEVSGTGLIYRIVSVDSPTQVGVTPALPNRITTSSAYRILRGSRALGDEPLLLPDTVIIDLDTNTKFPSFTNPLPQSASDFDPVTGSRIQMDILFAPSGQLISPSVATDKVHLWVRVPNTDFPTDPFRGDPTLVSIFVRTGFVGAYSPNPAAIAGGNPYSFVQ